MSEVIDKIARKRFEKDIECKRESRLPAFRTDIAGNIRPRQ